MQGPTALSAVRTQEQVELIPEKLVVLGDRRWKDSGAEMIETGTISAYERAFIQCLLVSHWLSLTAWHHLGIAAEAGC